MATKEVAQELIQRHPLQRLESPSRGASALLHVSRNPILNKHVCVLTIFQITGLASFAYSFSYLVLNPNQM
jgi:hypothetical protein